MVILAVDPADEERCQILSTKVGVPVVTKPPESYFLTFVNDLLVAKDPRQGRHFLLSVDVQKEFEKAKSQKINSKKDLLCRALSFRGQANYTVFDGTFGFGRDSFQLLALGCAVIGCEANPITHAMLESELSQLKPGLNQLQLVFGDTLEEFPAYTDSFDCLYLDPMFENIKKKSAPKKHMAFLREIAIPTSDVSLVIERAIKLGVKRVVVKRPINGDHLYETPQNTIEGKLVRYDVYLG